MQKNTQTKKTSEQRLDKNSYHGCCLLLAGSPVLECCSKLTSLCSPLHHFKNKQFATECKLKNIHHSCCRTWGWGWDFLPHSYARTPLLKGLLENLRTAARIWGLQRSFLTGLNCLCNFSKTGHSWWTLIRYFQVFLMTQKAGRDTQYLQKIVLTQLTQFSQASYLASVSVSLSLCCVETKNLKICLAQALQWVKIFPCIMVGKIS